MTEQDKSAHTAERWRVDPKNNCDIQSEDGTREIASTHPGLLNGGFCDPSTAQGYARLIAAAPELLEALKALLAHDESDAGCIPTDAHLDAQEAARAAIAKATGADQ